MDDTLFPNGFYSLGGKTFAWAYKNQLEWKDFTITDMKNPTGLYKVWQDYCFKKAGINKNSNDKINHKQSQRSGKSISEQKTEFVSCECRTINL